MDERREDEIRRREQAEQDEVVQGSGREILADRFVELYKDTVGLWRWRLVAKRGNLPDAIIAVSGEGYTKRSHALGKAADIFPQYEVTYGDPH